MTHDDILQVVLDAITMANNARDDDNQIPVSANTELYGNSGYLDSMALVSFLIEVEESLLDQDIEISLSDERAMSQTRSPFRNVQSLVGYIETLLTDAG